MREWLFPICDPEFAPQEEDPPWWRLNKANWEEFRSLCLKHLIQNKTYSAAHFTDKKYVFHTNQPLINGTDYGSANNAEKLSVYDEQLCENLI